MTLTWNPIPARYNALAPLSGDLWVVKSSLTAPLTRIPGNQSLVEEGLSKTMKPSRLYIMFLFNQFDAVKALFATSEWGELTSAKTLALQIGTGTKLANS